MATYKQTGNKGLFDEQETYQKLIEKGNPLGKYEKFTECKESFGRFRLIGLYTKGEAISPKTIFSSPQR